MLQKLVLLSDFFSKLKKLTSQKKKILFQREEQFSVCDFGSDWRHIANKPEIAHRFTAQFTSVFLSDVTEAGMKYHLF